MHALLGYFRTTTGTMQNIRKAVAAVTRSLLLHQRYSTNRNIPPVFKVITNNVDVKSSSFEANTTFNCELEEKYNVFLKMISAGGGEKAIERHTVKNKKTLVWDRLKQLFDDVDDILELSSLSGINMAYGNVPRAGIISAIGRIQGVYCLVLANDATVTGGTVYPITVKKQLRGQEIAEINHLPAVYVVDSGGAFLPLQADIFTQGGRSFYNEAILNSKNIPQLAVVCGSCTAGAAYIPTMSQEAVIVDKIGTIFLGGPPLVYAALGEVVSAEDLGGGRMHSSVSGCTDYFTGTEQEAISISRDVVSAFNVNPPESPQNYDEPLYDPEEITGIIPNKDQHTMDMYQVIARLVDGSRFHEFKAMYGTTLVTGFAFLKGYLVGILGNNGVMTQDSALKGSHFVQLCSQRNIPIIFLQNSAPDSDFLKSQGSWEEVGMTMRSHGQLMTSVATANVPKITVIVGNSYGVNNYMMCGRSFDPRFVFSWPNAKVCMVEPSEAPYHVNCDSSHDEESMSKLSCDLEVQSSAFHSAFNIWDDGMILPRQTRQVLGKCLEIINQVKGFNTQHREYGVLRM